MYSKSKKPTTYRKYRSASKTGVWMMKAACSEGFTRVELLLVIIIIAILAAIIYPVFSSVMETNRQATAMSNMHDISSKIAEFELDKHAAPTVLFGYAVRLPGTTTAVSMADALAEADKDGTTATYFPGLYPTYINSVSEFTDPNDPVATTDTLATNVNAVQGPAVNILETDGALCQTTPGSGFYGADAYDSSPRILGANSLDQGNTTTAGTWVTRYQPAWTEVTSNAATPLANDPTGLLYQQQLHWQYPPSGTYITSDTYHVPKSNIILVLFEDGTVHKFDTKTFTSQDGGTDPATIASGVPLPDPGSPQGVAAANFWQLTPNS